MKAQYILAALEAMRDAEKILTEYPSDPGKHYERSTKIFSKLQDARIDLKVYSGVGEMKVEVEAE